ncbi:hypothetical protein BDR22DRAFT_826259 [Usnea florida]
MSPIPEPAQKHVPAWKKLGLKLKFAKEEPENTQPGQNGTYDSRKRKVPAEEEYGVGEASVEKSTKNVKKVRKSKSRAEEAEEAVNGLGISDEPRYEDEQKKKKLRSLDFSIKESSKAVNGNKRSSNEPANEERPPKKVKMSKVKPDISTLSFSRKPDGTQKTDASPLPALKSTPSSKEKSVSFTPDTKAGDGDSVKSLYKTWLAKQIATDPSFDPSTVSPALRSIVPTIVASPESPSSIVSTSTLTSTSKPTAKDNKKPIRKSKSRLPKISTGSGPSRFDPVLTYLTAHQTSPQNWKFSKPHQNQIFKHLFSFSHIPSSYDSALHSYIRGLKGTSVRSRVRRGAFAVREEDDKWLTSEPSETEKMENETVAQCNARRRRDYEAAVARVKQTLREREEKREELDWELLGEKEEWEERFRKRRRAEIVLWNVGEEEDEAADDESAALQQQNASGGNPEHPMNSGFAQLAQAARDPGPAPRLGRGVGMGMGGVEVIDAGGIARASQGKKVVFGDDGAEIAANGTDGATAYEPTNGVKNLDARDPANGVKPWRKRKRKLKLRTGVPDDDESSSESSDSSVGSSGGKKGEQEQETKRRTQLKAGGDDSSDDETSSFGTSSSGDLDSDSD